MDANSIGNIIGIAVAFGVAFWVHTDAQAIGSDNGRMPGLVKTQPKLWAAGVFLLLIIVLPIYLFQRIRFKRLAAERKAEIALMPSPIAEVPEAPPGVWPPPPSAPAMSR